jgi:hypothetical protein
MGADEAILLAINTGWGHPAVDRWMLWLSERWTFAFPLLALLLADGARRAGGKGVRPRVFLLMSVGDLQNDPAKVPRRPPPR